MTDLRKLAEAARESQPKTFPIARPVHGFATPAQMDYIAAASPDVILALLDVADAARDHADISHSGVASLIGLPALREALARLDALSGGTDA